MKYDQLTNILRSEVIPALGCTAPAAVALASARCKKELTAPIISIITTMSPGIYKNGWGVCAPGTNAKGNNIAAALGVIAGDSDLGLEVLNNANSSDVEAAIKMVDQGIVKTVCTKSESGLFIEVVVTSENETVRTILRARHDNIVFVEVNSRIVFESHDVKETKNNADLSETLSIDDLIVYIENTLIDDIHFLIDGVAMNMSLAQEGLNSDIGLNTASALLLACDLQEPPDDDVVMKARILTCAAGDARMGGSLKPAMSSVGSGNQGITAILPVAVVAHSQNISDEKLARALALSHLVAYYVKMRCGRIASACLCAIASGAGAAAGITWMLNGDANAVKGAIKNVLSSLAGMFCDGAKNSCALKMGAAASEAIIASRLALNDVQVGYFDGFADDSVEDTLENLSIITNATKEIINNSMVEILEVKSTR